MENEILLQIVDRLDNIDREIAEVKAEQQEMKAEQQEMKLSLQQQIDDMRGSQMLFEQRMTKQMGAIMDSHAVIMDIARDTQKILHLLQASQEKYDSEKVAVDVTLIDHEKRLVCLERQAV